jgi:hypothetical protein
VRTPPSSFVAFVAIFALLVALVLLAVERAF